MQNLSYQYIGGLSLKCLKEYISEQRLTSADSIVLSQVNLDELALEYRNKYGQGIVLPFFLSEVWIKEDQDQHVPIARIEIIKNDPQRLELENMDYIETDID